MTQQVFTATDTPSALPVNVAETGSDFDTGHSPEQGMGLCLSGGGYRAMLFHVGALWRLYEADLLKELRRIGQATLMQSAGIDKPQAPQAAAVAGTSPPPSKTAREWADFILASDVLVHVGRDGSRLFGKVRTWIEADEMKEALEGVVPAPLIERARELFPRMEKSLRLHRPR